MRRIFIRHKPLKLGLIALQLIGCQSAFEPTVSDKRAAESAETPSETEENSPEEIPANLKLNNPDCIDPDLGKVAEGVELMLCDGTIARGDFKLLDVALEAPEFIELKPENIRAGVIIGGVKGTASAPPICPEVPDPPTTCSVDGEQNCLLTADFKAVAVSNLIAGNIKRGTTIAGVTGDYPSSTSPLLRYSDSGSTTNTQAEGGITDDLVSFSTDITTDGSFEYWDQTGVRRTGSGDSDLTAANVKTGTAIESLGINGIYPTACSSDAETDCLANASFPAADASVLDTGWNVRYGTTVAGVAGKLKGNCANSISAIAPWDWWDTVTDGMGPIPANLPAGWDQYYCDATNWEDVSVEGGGAVGCDDAADECMFKDKLSGLTWAEDQTGLKLIYQDAVDECNNLDFGGQTNWRLPTQKELMTVVAHGIMDIVVSPHFINDSGLGGGSNERYMSSTTSSSSATSAVYVDLGTGYFAYTAKSVLNGGALCVSP